MHAGFDCICILFANTVSLQLTSRDQSHVHGNVLKSHLFYRFLLHINLDWLILIFFNAYFFTHSSTQNLHCLGYKIIMIFQGFSLWRTASFHRHHLNLTNFQNQAQHKRIPKEHVIIHFDELWNYLYPFQKMVAASFFVNINCNFLYQGKVWHHTSIFIETNVHFMRFFVQRHLLFKSSQLLRAKKIKSVFI